MRKKGIGTKYILISAMLFMGLLGITYATWNESIGLGTFLMTGNARLEICGFVDPEDGMKILDFNAEGNSVDFTAEIADEHQGILKLLVKNTGSLPVKVQDKTIESGDAPTEIDITVSEGFTSANLQYTLTNDERSWEKNINITGKITTVLTSPDAIVLTTE